MIVLEREKYIMKPMISIIVPVFNGEKYISSFLKCINEQIYKNIEVIFIDDGSVDNTLRICKEYALNDDRVVVLHKENGGPSSARNLGIKRSSGKYVVFFDIDDVFSDTVLSDNFEIATRYDADIVMWNFKINNLGNKREYVNKIGSFFNGSSNEFFCKYLIPVLDNEMFNPPWNKMIKRSLLIDNDIHFDERFSIYEDILFSYRLMQKAERISINDNVYYEYIIKEQGSLLTKFHEERFKVILEIYKEARKYGEMFTDNKRQQSRFSEQLIYLTKGYIKQICTNESILYDKKKLYLSEIADNDVYREISKEYDVGMRTFPAKIMMRYRLFGILIFYYRILNYFQ